MRIQNIKIYLSLLLITIFICTFFSLPVVNASYDDLLELKVTHIDRRTYRVSASADYSDGMFIAASFAECGSLIGVEICEASAGTEAGKTVSTADFDLSSVPYLQDTAEIKFLFWQIDNLRPLTSVSVKDMNTELTEVAQGLPVGGKGIGGKWSDTTKLMNADNIVDGDASTFGGFYANFGNYGNMYIDLGDEYKVDRVDILAYYGNDTIPSPMRAGDFDLVLSNSVEEGAASSSVAESGTVLLAHVGCTAANIQNSEISNVPYQSFYTEGTGKYRYLSLEKFSPNSEAGYGLVIAEVKIYVRTEDMPEPTKYVEVAQGKPMGGKSSGNFCGTNEYGQFKDLGQHPTALTDGNYDTYAGFYASFGTTGNMYVDLGIPYKIDHIDVLAYNGNYLYRAGDCDLVVSNSVTDNAPSTDENKLLVAHIPAATASTAAEAEFKTYPLNGNDGSYRYVSLEKFQENPYGLLIAEVRVYVKTTDLEFSFDEYLSPVWKGNTVYNESITFIPDPKTHEITPAPLLYTPQNVISVKSYDLQTEYKEGVDYAVENGKIRLLEGGGMSAWDYDEYYSPDEGYYKISWLEPEGRYIHFGSGDYQERHQYYVTYTHEGVWEGVVPQYSGLLLPKTTEKLKNGEKIRILFNGDSITAGGEASGCGLLALRDGSQNVGAPCFSPHMPIYSQLVIDKLRMEYPDSDIEYLNTSNPGSSSKTGSECAEWWVKAHKADLVVLAWGMNDISFAAEDHKTYIETIIDQALEANQDTEFILVATMLPNIGSSWADNHLSEFITMYEEIKEERSNVGIAIAPMTTMHQYLLSVKRDADMSANGINHPNDFLQRIYAQTISAMLIED